MGGAHGAPGGVAMLEPQALGFGRLFDRIQEAVVVVDVASERIVLWNPAATALFGYAPVEALALPLTALMPPDLRARHTAAFAHYRATGRGALIEGGRPVEVPALHKGGAELRVELSLSPLEDAAAGGRYVLALIRDVTDRARLEAERARQAHLAGVLLAARTVEHELRNDLAAASGAVELLGRDPDLSSAQRSRVELALGRVREAATRLDRLRQLAGVALRDWGAGLDPTIDLARAPEDDP